MSSNDIVVRVENLGKRYMLPHVDNANKKSKFAAHLKEFLPFLTRDEDDYFWALKNLNFEVRQGEILGILGKNGSGKSTLLKILSGITQPTTGRASFKGRVASLLEVGTGFHPDMTGRENVFMAGALLGISQTEIKAKFDEILDFSGIEKFIDMPVKRYSSGMYVRLAYSVAALLRSDILILDEVMAVGDQSFREKSQNNIEKISNEGRTILFVSHNARAVTAICKTGMILDSGSCVYQGTAKEAVGEYLKSIHLHNENINIESKGYYDLKDASRLDSGTNKYIEWVSTHSIDEELSNNFYTGGSMIIRIGFSGLKITNPYFSILICNEYAERVATISSTHNANNINFSSDGVLECRIDDLRLGEGDYRIMLDCGYYGGSRALFSSYDCVPNAAKFHVNLKEYVKGVGVDAFQGAVHKSIWKSL